MRVLLNNPLFKGVALYDIEQFLNGCSAQKKEYLKASTPYDNLCNAKEMMFLLKGVARVEQIHEDGHRTFLKRLKAGNMFGVLSIFNESNYFPTTIIFEEDSEVLVLNEKDVLYLLQKDTQLLKNYLHFFNGQVEYLLNRITLFSTLSGEDRLLLYLQQLKKQLGSNHLRIPMTKIELSEYLSLGRSTLYRAIDQLVEKNIIEVERDIIILKK